MYSILPTSAVSSQTRCLSHLCFDNDVRTVSSPRTFLGICLSGMLQTHVRTAWNHGHAMPQKLSAWPKKHVFDMHCSKELKWKPFTKYSHIWWWQKYSRNILNIWRTPSYFCLCPVLRHLISVLTLTIVLTFSQSEACSEIRTLLYS